MGGINKFGTNSLDQFLDSPDIVYGNAVDGSVVFDGTSVVLGMTPSSSVYSMTRDIYCYNLTIADSVSIAPNGYRIFVKNLLTFGNGSTIGWTGGYSTDGSIKQGGAAGVSVTHSLGGSGSGSGAGTATVPTAATGGVDYYKQPLQAIRGYSITAGNATTYLRGGAGGSTGVGGGVIICAARYIACSATSVNAKFSAPGGATGGGGGVVILVTTQTELPSNMSVDVSGNSGAGSGTYSLIRVI